MPKLFQETKTVQLETQPEISITMKIGMTMGQNMVLQKKYPQMTDSTSPDAISAGVEMITMSIIDRNIEDDNGVLPITFENVQKLSMIDIATLMTMVVGEKKK